MNTAALALISLLTLGITSSDNQKTGAPPANAKTTAVSDQVGRTIWKKSDAEGSPSVEQIWISAHRPTTGIVTILHERRDITHGGHATRTWATYELYPGEVIHLSCAIGSNTKIVIVSETVPKGVVKVTATEQ